MHGSLLWFHEVQHAIARVGGTALTLFPLVAAAIALVVQYLAIIHFNPSSSTCPTRANHTLPSFQQYETS